MTLDPLLIPYGVASLTPAQVSVQDGAVRCPAPYISIGPGKRDILRLNGDQYDFPEAPDLRAMTDAHAQLDFLHEHLRHHCDLWARPPKLFLEQYFAFIAAQVTANNATLAGHVVLEDHVIMGGLSGAQQYVRIGRNAIIGAMAGAKSDVIPFGMVMGRPGLLAGLNIVGLKRAGVGSKEIQALMKAYDHLFGKEGTFAERIETVEKTYGGQRTVDALLGFLKAETSRPILQPEDG